MSPATTGGSGAVFFLFATWLTMQAPCGLDQTPELPPQYHFIKTHRAYHASGVVLEAICSTRHLSSLDLYLASGLTTQFCTPKVEVLQAVNTLLR